MGVLKKIFIVLSKGFDASKGLTKDDDIKDILVGISAVFALLVSGIKIMENIRSAKRIFRIKKIK